MWLLSALFFSLIAVFLTELPFGYFLGARSRRKFFTVILANIVTNPAVVLVSFYLLLFASKWHGTGIFFMELLAFLAEGFIFSKCKTFDKKNPYIVSALLNTLSFAIGEIINIFL